MEHVVSRAILVLFVMLWLTLISFLRLKKKRSYRYLLLFTIFYIYIYKVLDYTLFQFQSLLLLKQFMPNLMLRGTEPGTALNLIPLVKLTGADLKTSLLNILLFVPFGFGLPFITNLNMKRIFVYGMLFSIGIEFLQYFTGLLAGMTFRVADINDVFFNSLGVVVGYILSVGFTRVIRFTSRTRSN